MSGLMIASATQTIVKITFESWNPVVRKLVSLLPEKLNKWAMYDILLYFTRGENMPCGDAAHASRPHHGAGAGLGIEDALCLFNLMRQVSSSTQKSLAIKTQL